MKGGSYNTVIECLHKEFLRAEKEAKEGVDFWSAMAPGCAPASPRAAEQKAMNKRMVDINLDHLGNARGAQAMVAPLRGKLPQWHSPEFWTELLEALHGEVSEFIVRFSRVTERYREEFLSGGQGDRAAVKSVLRWERELEAARALLGHLEGARSQAAGLLKAQAEWRQDAVEGHHEAPGP